MMSDNPIIYAVDFDGTLCKELWPDIGEPNMKLVDFLVEERRKGNAVILYTMREGIKLDEALIWCKELGLTFDAINDNLPRIKGFYGNNPRKIFANYYIDDHNDTRDWNFSYYSKHRQ